MPRPVADPHLELAPPLDAGETGVGGQAHGAAPPAVAPRAPIALLPEAESAKIKAGEVVERPANIVKELVENALDAGATRISIELEDGGKQLIRVTDNGQGIPADELPLALLRHATSKIRRLDDLYALSTLGFRGEGLAAISAVSRIELSSRTPDSPLGARVAASGGLAGTAQALALQPGTVAEVRELFYNVPARLKFLRSAQAETSQVAALLDGYALAYPEVRWELRSGPRLLLRSDGDGDALSVLVDLCGVSVGQASLPAGSSQARRPAPPETSPFARIGFEFPPMAAAGWISEPRLHRHNRARQWFFINRRPVSNKLLFRAVDDSVREFMSEGKYPQGAFFLDLPPEEIDVNVHPMKLEVSFAQPQAVYSLLTTAVRRALGGAGVQRQQQLTRGLASIVQPLQRGTLELAAPVDTGSSPPLLDEPPRGQQHVPVFDASAPWLAPEAHGNSATVDGPRVASPLLAADSFHAEPPGEPSAEAEDWHYLPQAAVPPPPLPASLPPAFSGTDVPLPANAPQVTAIQQVAGAYLALLTPEAVYLVDQHAAHERILFETLYERLQAGGPAPPPVRQKLLFPLELRLSAAEAELAEDYCRELAKLGFAAQFDSAARTLAVGEVPQLLARRVTAELLQGSLAELAEAGASALLAEQGKQLAASLACRAAIKAGDRLPLDEQRALVTQLLARWSSLSCPHGRPTILRLGSGELEGLFLR